MPELFGGAEPVRARVIDFETTGLPEDEDARICEIGFVDVDLTKPDFPLIDETAYQSIINPGVPIRPEISAVHHITDEDVAGMFSVEIAYRMLAAKLTDADVYVAHNANFEQHFYSNRPQRWICTYRCALRAWPDAPGHSNQVLRYWLGLDLDRQRAQPPHRALPDAYVTAHILRKLLLLRPIERLVEISAQPALLPRLNFGKHRGMKFGEAPADYLRWLSEQKDMDEDVKFTARHYLKKREAA